MEYHHSISKPFSDHPDRDILSRLSISSRKKLAELVIKAYETYQKDNTHFSDCCIYDETGAERHGIKCDCGGAVYE